MENLIAAILEVQASQQMVMVNIKATWVGQVNMETNHEKNCMPGRVKLKLAKKI
jgi:helix-turn-helix protein